MKTDVIERGDAILEHYGVKGMKWGVRRAEKRAAKADNNWQKNIYSTNGAVAVHNRMAHYMNNGGIDRLNNDPRFKGKRCLGTPLEKAYLKQYEKIMMEMYPKAIRDVHGVSPSGKKRAVLGKAPDGTLMIKIEDVAVGHAGLTNAPDLQMEMIVENGQIVGAKMVSPTKEALDDVQMVQSSMERGSDFLEHYGIKGMKWGQRKGSSSVSSQPRTVTDRGARTADPRHLSNQDLKKMVARMEMEKKYRDLNAGTKSEGKKIVHDIIKSAPKVAASAVIGVLIKDLLKGNDSGAYNFAKSKVGKATSGAARRRARRSTPNAVRTLRQLAG